MAWSLLNSYNVRTVRGDRYAAEWPRERFRAHGIDYEVAERPKSDLYRDLLPILNSGRAELLDVPRVVSQLCGLERRTARGGRDSIDHAPGAHDDLANSVANNVGGTRLPESFSSSRPAPSLSYDDLIELPRLCLKQAAATSNAAAAAELRRMASEYQARAAALDEAPHVPDIAAAFGSSPQHAQPSQQQQQPQPHGPAGGDKDNGAPD
jgi:hypothetical protein